MYPKIAILCGDHPRNLFLTKVINDHYEIAGLVLQTRENRVPSLPSNLLDNDKNNYHKHFSNREKYENLIFGTKGYFPDCKTIEVSEKTLSSLSTSDFIDSIKPDLVFTFGVGFIRDPLFSSLPKNKINLHSGITPRYKGTACNFWPFYFLEPNWAGATFHLLTDKLDMGGIIHQITPPLELGDTIHEVACKAINLACLESLKIIDLVSSGKTLNTNDHKSSGRLFTNRDFRPHHLQVIYDLFNDNIVDYYLNSQIKPTSPKLITL